MSNNIILIGPVGVGKTSVAKELASKLKIPMISMDSVRVSYYKELGYDPNLAEVLYQKDGSATLWCYVKTFDAYSVERILQDYKEHIIDMGGGSSVHEHEDQFNRVKQALSPCKNIILLLPDKDNEVSLSFLNNRTGWNNKGRNINRILLNHHSNRDLATHTIYTQHKSPAQIADEIIKLIAD